MPNIILITNVKIDDVRSFVKEFSQKAAKVLAKPESYISIHVQYDPNLTFAGTFDPAFQMNVISLGNINPEANARYSKDFYAFLKEKLNLNDDRGYIAFCDPGVANIGFKSTTFENLVLPG